MTQAPSQPQVAAVAARAILGAGGRGGGVPCKLGPPIRPLTLQLSLLRANLHNLVQYLLSQPHFLGRLHGRQLGRLQLRHYWRAGKPRRVHTERQLPSTRSPGGPTTVSPMPAAGSLPGPSCEPGCTPTQLTTAARAAVTVILIGGSSWVQGCGPGWGISVIFRAPGRRISKACCKAAQRRL